MPTRINPLTSGNNGTLNVLAIAKLGANMMEAYTIGLSGYALICFSKLQFWRLGVLGVWLCPPTSHPHLGDTTFALVIED